MRLQWVSRYGGNVCKVGLRLPAIGCNPRFPGKRQGVIHRITVGEKGDTAALADMEMPSEGCSDGIPFARGLHLLCRIDGALVGVD